jgi:hypothetical protein
MAMKVHGIFNQHSTCGGAATLPLGGAVSAAPQVVIVIDMYIGSRMGNCIETAISQQRLSGIQMALRNVNTGTGMDNGIETSIAQQGSIGEWMAPKIMNVGT